eukprot:CAMPEP_0169208422 /NCGR_PEP_ID=MMETSP1016-20121227/14121_1 /TAXON_ID=342587 /ORGANISM="Karlodinium micrum, Strain CCMP2283" /LENGTH=154 /DNA_ID=CAMNT_0009285791 /DNA_START=304 /DNA_END=765 /DNA_ORIENTATION=-
MKAQEEAEDEHSSYLRCVQGALPYLIGLAWRSEKTDLPPAALLLPPPPSSSESVSAPKRHSLMSNVRPEAPGTAYIAKWVRAAHEFEDALAASQAWIQEEDMLQHAWTPKPCVDSIPNLHGPDDYHGNRTWNEDHRWQNGYNVQRGYHHTRNQW